MILTNFKYSWEQEKTEEYAIANTVTGFSEACSILTPLTKYIDVGKVLEDRYGYNRISMLSHEKWIGSFRSECTCIFYDFKNVFNFYDRDIEEQYLNDGTNQKWGWKVYTDDHQGTNEHQQNQTKNNVTSTKNAEDDEGSSKSASDQEATQKHLQDTQNHESVSDVAQANVSNENLNYLTTQKNTVDSTQANDTSTQNTVGTGSYEGHIVGTGESRSDDALKDAQSEQDEYHNNGDSSYEDDFASQHGNILDLMEKEKNIFTPLLNDVLRRLNQYFLGVDVVVQN